MADKWVYFTEKIRHFEFADQIFLLAMHVLHFHLNKGKLGEKYDIGSKWFEIIQIRSNICLK